ncbi:MAG: esterase family protein [Spirochaetia bacterium]|nr:esterase family protein [Spirochaetia bacterium]
MRKAMSAILMSLGFLFAIDDYTNGPDSYPKPGVPRGTVTEHEWTNSKIFPGTYRQFWIYVPAQAAEGKPVCLMIFQDGEGVVKSNGQWRATVVMDNLIHTGEIPVCAGLFVNPGRKMPVDLKKKPENRSLEYDTPSPSYGDFLLQELLPEVEKRVKITANPDGRLVCGSSSGGIAAFTAAWEHPDAFHKVVSFIGSFTDIRGGYIYPPLIRKTKPVKPLRVFLQDGTNDLDNQFGNWPLANQEMAAALKFSGYDYRFVLGDGGHSGKHGASLLPEIFRWIWRDWKEQGL